MPSLDHPYAGADRSPRWLRGNLHTHTTRSDGRRAPQEVIDDYVARGYDFLMFSDHDTYAGPEHFADWKTGGLSMIPGNEITRDGPHMLHVGATRKIEPSEDRQAVIDDIARTGGFAVVNHPNWFEDFNHCPHETMKEWTNFTGIEIYNHVIGELPGSSYATDHWDRLLARGRRVWGFANDDSHQAKHVGFAWNSVLSEDRSPAAIVAAMAKGRFYASTGVAIGSIAVEGMTITITSPDAERIVAIADHGARIEVADGREMTLTVPDGKTTYVRFECCGRGERVAWTQPFFVDRAGAA
ncbi:MAG: CehA/McbA family metallohydrolase [Planctomycetes bacterium]|nr:CehA/McbA family metallohydrolase [Planctomycetota bacterium]